jgi:hypothetical protein
MKSGNLNYLEPSGPLQACNGTALPLPFTGINTVTSAKYNKILPHEPYFAFFFQADGFNIILTLILTA